MIAIPFPSCFKAEPYPRELYLPGRKEEVYARAEML
jgi:hypothetical protein